jgi:putative PIN family toxin of toxin-antitoxin system
MRLVVDTNIIISALLKESTVRSLIFEPRLELCTPEFVFEEIEEHMDMIKERSGLTEEEVSLTLSLISAHIEVAPKEDFSHKMEDAEKVIGGIDEDDVPFVALALSFPNEGIWTNDKDFTRQGEVKVWDTAGLLAWIKERA